VSKRRNLFGVDKMKAKFIRSEKGYLSYELEIDSQESPDKIDSALHNLDAVISRAVDRNKRRNKHDRIKQNYSKA
jgi:hypothetical protein